MNVERHSVQTFLRISIIVKIDKFDRRLVGFRAAFWCQKIWPLKWAMVPHGLNQQRAGRPLRETAVCLEPLFESCELHHGAELPNTLLDSSIVSLPILSILKIVAQILQAVALSSTDRFSSSFSSV